jgi:hypothetical protein
MLQLNTLDCKVVYSSIDFTDRVHCSKGLIILVPRIACGIRICIHVQIQLEKFALFNSYLLETIAGS